MAKKMREQEKMTMYVDFNHLSDFGHNDPDFMKNIVCFYNRYEQDLRKGLVRFLMMHSPANSIQAKTYYQVSIFNLPQVTKIRDLRTQSLGRLMSIYGTVTRTTDAKPELIMGSFQCLECNNQVHNIE